MVCADSAAPGDLPTGSADHQEEEPAMKRRRRVLSPIERGGVWADYCEQRRIQAEHHSDVENAAARARASQLRDGGLLAVDWDAPDQLCLLWEQK
ncbi:hypothetical protein MITS9509_03506 [Synechococcus sp. MIT S9509]|uniref:hypothetical protein n=1 Tax=Synechococcus sp. MIT S9509 TaxID=1801630 RepID=UPI0007BC0709|nr:hypothetical protein [Synechococcus sp. MIT S9509]KZR86267.1 hypothetical protein MITS9509_03506 [Synechococcus sp. MIT S9509]